MADSEILRDINRDPIPQLYNINRKEFVPSTTDLIEISKITSSVIINPQESIVLLGDVEDEFNVLQYDIKTIVITIESDFNEENQGRIKIRHKTHQDDNRESFMEEYVIDERYTKLKIDTLTSHLDIVLSNESELELETHRCYLMGIK